MLRLFNTMTRKKEIFRPLRDKEVRIYSCGPTVYDYAHIGNFRAYIFADLLRRYLKYKGYRVKHVMNITDVDDKIIKRVNEQKVSLKEYTAKYIKAFFEDLRALNIEKFEYYPRATEHIDDMVRLIKILLKKGYAYKAEDGSIYFSISKFKDYGKLSGIKFKKIKAKPRIRHDEYSKEDISDFALWKAYTKEDGEVYWETELGKGRPGWHIECSAMSMKYLGETIDIHTGGVDLIFPHHENEIAQSEAATGKTFVRYWLHNEHLVVEGRKMSKSLGNYYTLRDLLSMGYDPKAIRFLLLSTHYRKKLNFTFESLKHAENTVRKLLDFMGKLRTLKPKGKYNEELKKKAEEAKRKFEEAMDDDLNISKALSAIFDLVNETNKLIEEKKVNEKNLKEIYKLMKEFDKVLGILEEEIVEVCIDELPEDVQKLIKEREEARKVKNYKKADEIREYLRKRGIFLEDTKEGTKVKVIKK